MNDARATVALYAGAVQYEEYFAAHRFREEARRLQEGAQRGGYASVAHTVPGEMAETLLAMVGCSRHGAARSVRDGHLLQGAQEGDHEQAIQV